MAFNGSGTYNLPAADLPVSGQVISSTKMNNVFSDLATALTACLAKDGQSTMTGDLKMGSQKITGLADGLVGGPAIAFANSSTTGIYSTGANKLAVTINGVKVLEIDAAAITGSQPFTGSGSGLTALNADNLGSGTVPLARLGSAVAYDLSAAKANTFLLGYRGIPASAKTSGTIDTTDVGKYIPATGGVTIPNATFSQGDAVGILNTTSSPITITASITTLRQEGTTNTGARTLAGYGYATVLFHSGTLGFIGGAGLS